MALAFVHQVLAGDADPGLPAGVPDDLLLLPRRVLQGVLGRPARLCRRRAAPRLPRRGQVAAADSEPAPLRALLRAGLHRAAVDRRGEGVLLQQPQDRAHHVRGRRRLAGAAPQRRAHRRLHARLPLVPPPGGRVHGHLLQVAVAQEGLRLRQLPQPPSPQVGLVLAGLGGAHRRLHSPLRQRRHHRPEDLLMPVHETHEHDVLIIGAGGAGLRAAIEASASGMSVGLVCKSLLGKAHTVMAEGGVAAAMAHVDDRDSWKVHFSDTMRGGQYLNNWRMAELHAKEAPDRVRELEAWGAVFDRTKDGRILQRNFGGHRYPRLAHVGDRTGLEMIRTLQDHGIHQGIEVHMECTIVSLLKDGDRVVGAFGYEREHGRFVLWQAKAVIVATGGIGRAYKITSNSWEGTGDGHALAYHAGAELIDMEFIQFHPTGMIWPPSVRGLLVTEGVRGEGGVLRNKDGRRFLFDDIPENYKSQTADSEEEGWKYTQGDKSS